MYKIYSKDNCTYCTAAKSLLSSKNIPFVELKIGKDVTKESLLEVVPGARSVPQIFHTDNFGNENYVGGYDNLVKHLKETSDDTGRAYITE